MHPAAKCSAAVLCAMVVVGAIDAMTSQDSQTVDRSASSRGAWLRYNAKPDACLPNMVWKDGECVATCAFYLTNRHLIGEKWAQICEQTIEENVQEFFKRENIR